MSTPKPKQQRGFAVMDPEAQRQIASSGGRKAHATGVAHQWTVVTAREAGRRGGLLAQQRRRDARAAKVAALATQGDEASRFDTR